MYCLIDNNINEGKLQDIILGYIVYIDNYRKILCQNIGALTNRYKNTIIEKIALNAVGFRLYLY